MYNPYRGRDTYAFQSDGGTRYARLPPVIEIIPLRGISYLTLRHIDNTQRNPLSGYLLPHTHAYR